MAVYVYDDNRIFLSTPSARRATKDSLCMANLVYISIHALREEGDAISPINPTSGGNFYPRPPRGGRLFKRSKQLRPAQFLSTPSARRATLVRDFCYCGQIISSHALREEGDPYALPLLVVRVDFSINALRQQGGISTGTTPRTA